MMQTVDLRGNPLGDDGVLKMLVNGFGPLEQLHLDGTEVPALVWPP